MPVKTGIIFGASGGLSCAIADALIVRGHLPDLVTRMSRCEQLERRYGDTARIIGVDRYSNFESSCPHDIYFFAQALFSPRALISTRNGSVEEQFEAGLVDHVLLTRKLLMRFPPKTNQRRDYCYIGSTSAYAGFKNTAVYCAVKHGLLGFVRAMNDEYAHTDTRFWLFSPGTVDTVMGCKVTDQDRDSFLKPEDVAERIVEAISSPSNLFEPEVIMRRRTIRFLEK